MLSEPKRSTTPQVQLNDLDFCRNATTKRQGIFSEVREKSGKVRETKVEKAATLYI